MDDVLAGLRADKFLPIVGSKILTDIFSPQQTCAVCLEEFCSRDELGVCPCSHAFHKK